MDFEPSDHHPMLHVYLLFNKTRNPNLFPPLDHFPVSSYHFRCRRHHCRHRSSTYFLGCFLLATSIKPCHSSHKRRRWLVPRPYALLLCIEQINIEYWWYPLFDFFKVDWCSYGGGRSRSCYHSRFFPVISIFANVRVICIVVFLFLVLWRCSY